MSSARAAHRKPMGRLSNDHPGVVAAGRLGWCAKGAVYVVAGILALLVAAKAAGWSGVATTPDQEASLSGALKTVAQASGGTLLMWTLALGMLIFAAWRVASALLPGGKDAKAWVTRVGYVVSAVIYTSFAVTAIALARTPSEAANGNAKVTSLSQRIMVHSGGRVVIGVVGTIAICAGLYRLVKGMHQDVSDELDMAGMSAQRSRWTKRLGAIGEIGRGIGIGFVGFFLVRAAVTYDSSQATGLDGALRRLAVQPWGLVIVVIIGAGFAAYGIFCLATFTRRRLQAP